MSVLRICFFATLFVAGFAQETVDLQVEENLEIISVAQEVDSSELITIAEPIVRNDSFISFPTEIREMPPLLVEELHSDFRKRSWQYIETSLTPPFGIPGSLGYGYRTLGDVHGWDASLHVDYFSTVYIPDFGTFSYQAVSAELSYLPHFFINDTAVYFGIGGGGGIGKGLFSASSWEAFPVLYIKPGIQFALNKDNSTAMSVDMKIAYPKLISLNSAIAF